MNPVVHFEMPYDDRERMRQSARRADLNTRRGAICVVLRYRGQPREHAPADPTQLACTEDRLRYVQWAWRSFTHRRAEREHDATLGYVNACVHNAGSATCGFISFGADLMTNAVSRGVGPAM
jgi:hypothetical protein